MRGERWEMRGERWEMRGERWEVRGERWVTQGLSDGETKWRKPCLLFAGHESRVASFKFKSFERLCEVLWVTLWWRKALSLQFVILGVCYSRISGFFQLRISNFHFFHAKPAKDESQKPQRSLSHCHIITLTNHFQINFSSLLTIPKKT